MPEALQVGAFRVSAEHARPDSRSRRAWSAGE